MCWIPGYEVRAPVNFLDARPVGFFEKRLGYKEVTFEGKHSRLSHNNSGIPDGGPCCMWRWI